MKIVVASKVLFGIATIVLLCSPTSAQLDWTEVEIPMSDDLTLGADVYLPEFWTSGPAIVIQTPYNKNLYHFGLPIGIGLEQATLEYAIVIVDWRGFFGSSDAAYSGAPTRGEDGYACVQWIASQTWCDGNVGSWGPSALGNIQFQTAAENPPNLKCIAPLVASPQFDYIDYYPGGTLRTEYVEQLDNLGFGLGPIIISNPYYNFVWSISEALNYYPEDIGVPTLMIGGWYDHNVETMIRFFEGIQNESPAEVQDEHRLIMGPWGHGGNGTASMGGLEQGQLEYPNAAGWSDSLVWIFFDHYLKNLDNGWELSPPVRYFQMGVDQWQNSNAWPTEDTEPVALYLHSDGSLQIDQPTDNSSLAYLFNPEDPSPTIGGPTLRNDLEQGPYDQAPEVESRNDILIFSTDVLNEDVTLQGSATVHLSISSETVDTDFMVRLCDVYPDGRSMLVCDGAFRMRFKNGFEMADESFLIPGEVYACEIDLPNTAITFLAGHRIRIDVTSSNYPRFNRNMNTGEEMYPNLNGDVLVEPLTTTNTIHTSATQASFVTLPLVGGFPSTLNELQTQGTIEIYPQPCNTYFVIKLQRDHELPFKLKLFAHSGQLVLEENCSTSLPSIDTSGLTTGMYLLQVITRNSSYNSFIEIIR